MRSFRSHIKDRLKDERFGGLLWMSSGVLEVAAIHDRLREQDGQIG